MVYAQYFILASFVVGFFLNIARDINGRPQQEPAGVVGVFVTIVTYAVCVYIYWRAGAFGAL